VRDTVVLFLLNQKNDYQAAMYHDASQAAEQHGLKLEVHDAGTSSDRQSEQILSVVRGPTARSLLALLVHPVVDHMHEAAAREATKAGMGWVLLNREAEYVHDLRRLYPTLPIFCVTPDQDEIGRAQGRLVRALLPKGGRVLGITGPFRASSARQRRRGLEEAVHGGAIQAVWLTGDWSQSSGEAAVRTWELRVDGAQRHPAFHSFFPDLVVAQNDSMAAGAERAIREVATRRSWPQMSRVPVVGCDGTAELGLRLVENKTLVGTVVVPSTAAESVQLVSASRRKGPLPGAKILLAVHTVPALDAIVPIERPR
jgi:ABC-type sugar transport system substrate-binding protein